MQFTSKTKTYLFGAIASGLLAFFSLAAYTNVSTEPTPEDIAVFKDNFALQRQLLPLDYTEQIKIIRAAQTKIFQIAPLGKGIPDGQSREPADLVRAAQGLCYDRSRSFDKVFAFLGFETRHVFILYKEEKAFLHTLVSPGSASHAVTEVKTSRGWLLVDSNSPWIAVTKAGEPVDSNNVWKRLNEFDDAPEQMRRPWWAIYGLYSRHGKLYPPYTPFPDINWRDLLSAHLL